MILLTCVVVAAAATKHSTPVAQRALGRLCVIHSRGQDDHGGLGFSLHHHPGQHGSAGEHVIGGVVAGSPAADAGLRDGDRVIEVIGLFIDHRLHTAVC